MAGCKCKVMIRAIKLRIYILTKCFYHWSTMYFLALSLRSSAKYDFLALATSHLVQKVIFGVVAQFLSPPKYIL